MLDGSNGLNRNASPRLQREVDSGRFCDDSFDDDFKKLLFRHVVILAPSPRVQERDVRRGHHEPI